MNGLSLLESTKSILKALVVSSPKPLTMHDLNLDFKKREGRDIPFSLLGHANLKSLINSMPDVLTLDNHFVKPVESSSGNSSVSHNFL